MKMLLKIFLLLPAFAYGSIRVYLKAATLETGGHVEYIGANVDVVSEPDISTFGLDEENLARGIQQFGDTQGYINARCSVKNSELSNLHERNNWNEVSRRIIPMTGEILNVNSEKIPYVSKSVYNENDEVTKSVKMIGDVFNTIKVHWNHHGHHVSKGEKIRHEIDLGIDGVDVIIKHAFDVIFGEDKNEEIYEQIGQPIELNVGPQQQVRLQMDLTRISMDVMVNYTVSLAGDVACEYPEAVNGKNLWAFDVNKVLEAAGSRNTVEWSEIINVVFYSNPEVIILGNGNENQYN